MLDRPCFYIKMPFTARRAGESMKHRYLEVTFREGKPFAAYLYLPRLAAAKAARTTDARHGVRVDFDAQGTRSEWRSRRHP